MHHLSDKAKTRIRAYGAYVAEALAFVVILAGVYAYQTRNLLPSGGQPAPVLRGLTLDGERVDLRSDGAPATLIYFFAPWCRVCAASSHNLRQLRRIRGDQQLRILLVALDWQTAAEVQDYVERHDIALPVLLGDRKIANDWNIYAYPTYYMLNGSQQIVRRDLGYSTLAGLWWRSGGFDR